jgi:FMN phosphatase YigB (HAD superfamily)
MGSSELPEAGIAKKDLLLVTSSMLIFDFDGVLLDSVREIAVTAYNMLKGTTVTRLNQLPPNAFELFLRNRFHVQPVGDAPVLMQWCLDNGDVAPDKLLSPKEYNAVISQSDEPVAARTDRFFECRSRFKTRDFQAWVSLNEPVQPLWRVLIEKMAGDLVLLTNKNREATLSLSRHFGLTISKANVYSGDHGKTKIENMTRIMQRFNRSKYIFIDDSIKNLRELDEHFNGRQNRLSLIFAQWGYSGPDDLAYAKNLGYQAPTMEAFIDQLQPRR